MSHVLGQNWVSGTIFTRGVPNRDMKKRKLEGPRKVKTREKIPWLPYCSTASGAVFVFVFTKRTERF